jgi:hypothetical protein
MDWRWIVLSAVVKIFFALGPKTVRSKEFAFGDGPEWTDIQELMAVAASRSMLASLPITLTIQTYLKTDIANNGFCTSGVAPLPAVVIILVAALLVTGMLLIPARKLRDTSRLIPLVIFLILLESGYTYAIGNTKLGRDGIVNFLCQIPTQTAASTPAAPAASSMPASLPKP